MSDRGDLPDRFETVDLDVDPEEADEWVPVGNLVTDDSPIYWNPKTQQMAIMDDEETENDG